MESIKNFIDFKKEKEAKQMKMQLEAQRLEEANKNGYETYRDYEFAFAKGLSRDPRFPLNKEYYTICQKYLIETLNAYLLYIKTGSVYNRNNANEGFVLTVYSLNELSNTILEGNTTINGIISNMNINPIDFVSHISEPQINVRQQKIN
jgi:hypothetical protein